MVSCKQGISFALESFFDSNSGKFRWLQPGLVTNTQETSCTCFSSFSMSASDDLMGW